MSQTIDYYHFLLSPWSFLAINRFNKIRDEHKVAVNYKPIDVMKTFADMGGVPPLKRHPSRQRFRMDELKRWSKHVGVKMNFNPAHWPTNQVNAAKMVYAAGGADAAAEAGVLSDAILNAVWAEDRDIADDATMVAIADSCGLDGKALHSRAQADDMQVLYESTTLEAHGNDVFGSPTYIVDGEIFWGQDRLEFLDKALG